MEEFYMDIAMNLLNDIRFKIEGAVELFENDAASLRNMAVAEDMFNAVIAFDTIGAALYALRKDIRKLHEAHITESVRQAREEEKLYIVKEYKEDQVLCHEFGLLEYAKLKMQTECHHCELYVCVGGKEKYMESVN